jgi:hypothetical protein
MSTIREVHRKESGGRERKATMNVMWYESNNL